MLPEFFFKILFLQFKQKWWFPWAEQEWVVRQVWGRRAVVDFTENCFSVSTVTVNLFTMIFTQCVWRFFVQLFLICWPGTAWYLNVDFIISTCMCCCYNFSMLKLSDFISSRQEQGLLIFDNSILKWQMFSFGFLNERNRFLPLVRVAETRWCLEVLCFILLSMS